MGDSSVEGSSAVAKAQMSRISSVLEQERPLWEKYVREMAPFYCNLLNEYLSSVGQL